MLSSCVRLVLGLCIATVALFAGCTIGSTPGLTLSVPGNAREGNGTLSAAGAVTVPWPEAKDRLVTLSVSPSTAADELTIPGFVLVPANAIKATFNITITDDQIMDGPQSVTITATVAGYQSASATIVIDDNDGLSVDLPATVLEGGSGTGTVAVPAAVTTKLVVYLGTQSTEVALPSQVVIAAGTSSSTFGFAIADNTTKEGDRVAEVTASANGYVNASDRMVIQDND